VDVFVSHGTGDRLSLPATTVEKLVRFLKANNIWRPFANSGDVIVDMGGTVKLMGCT